MLKKSIRKSAGRVSVYFPAVIDEYAPFHQSKLLQWAVARPQVAHSPNFPSRTDDARGALTAFPLGEPPSSSNVARMPPRATTEAAEEFLVNPLPQCYPGILGVS